MVKIFRQKCLVLGSEINRPLCTTAWWVQASDWELPWSFNSCYWVSAGIRTRWNIALHMGKESRRKQCGRPSFNRKQYFVFKIDQSQISLVNYWFSNLSEISTAQTKQTKKLLLGISHAWVLSTRLSLISMRGLSTSASLAIPFGDRERSRPCPSPACATG